MKRDERVSTDEGSSCPFTKFKNAVGKSATYGWGTDHKAIYVDGIKDCPWNAYSACMHYIREYAAGWFYVNRKGRVGIYITRNSVKCCCCGMVEISNELTNDSENTQEDSESWIQIKRNEFIILRAYVRAQTYCSLSKRAGHSIEILKHSNSDFTLHSTKSKFEQYRCWEKQNGKSDTKTRSSDNKFDSISKENIDIKTILSELHDALSTAEIDKIQYGENETRMFYFESFVFIKYFFVGMILCSPVSES